MKNIGDFIKQSREDKGIGLRELARRADISHSYLSQIENGNKKEPKSYILRALAHELNLDFNELLKITGQDFNWKEYDETYKEEIEEGKKQVSLLEQSISNYRNDIPTPIYLNKENLGNFYFVKDAEEIDAKTQEKLRTIIKTILD